MTDVFFNWWYSVKILVIFFQIVFIALVIIQLCDDNSINKFHVIIFSTISY